MMLGQESFDRPETKAHRAWTPKIAFHKRFDEEWDYPPTMGQLNRTADEQPRTIEQIIASRLLRQCVADVVIGPPSRRIQFINEIRDWMAPGADALYWSWDYWCEQLGWDSDYMRRKWRPFLDKCKAKAVELQPSYVRAINGHEMREVRYAHWVCGKCSVEGLGSAIAKRCKG